MDRAQTHESLKGCMLEEAYEVVDAINEKDDDNLKEELGMCCFRLSCIPRLPRETGRFDMSEVVDEVARKMVRRHPHIFGNAKAQDSEAVLSRWEDIKKQEKMKLLLYEGYAVFLRQCLRI